MKSLYYRCGIPITFYNQTPKMKWHYWGSGIPLAFDNQTLSFQFFDAQIAAVLEGPLRTHKVKLKFDKKLAVLWKGEVGLSMFTMFFSA